MIENDFIGIFEEEDSINFEKLDSIKPIEQKKPDITKDLVIQHTKEESEIIKHYTSEYITNLKNNYEAEEFLFDNLEDLINESEDKELLIKILDSL